MNIKRENVIFDSSDPRIKGLELKEVCYSDTFQGLCYGRVGVLAKVEDEEPYPFYIKHTGSFALIAPVPSYKERQTEWIKENDIKNGAKVRVLRKANSYENGWNTCWHTPMNACIGLEFTAIESRGEMGIRLYTRKETQGTNFTFPYFVLEVVPVPSYKPYKQWEDWMSDVVLKKKGTYESYNLIGRNPYNESEIYIVRGTNVYDTRLNFLFNHYERTDGTPFGEEV